MSKRGPAQVSEAVATGEAQQQQQRSALYTIGCHISEWVSNFAAHPVVQLGFIVFCVGWFVLGMETNLLTAALSIFAITLTQMVLNRQNEREAEAHRRDVAMHAKLDELVIATRRARNDMAGIEDLPEEVIAEIRQENLEKLSEASDEPTDEQPRMPSTRSDDG